MPNTQPIQPLIPFREGLILYTQFEFNGQDYLVFEPKVLYTSIHRRGLHLHTVRTFRAIAASLLYLNPELSFSRFKHYMDYIEEHHFSHPVHADTKERVYKWAWASMENDTLYPSGTLRRLVFNPACTLDFIEKMKIVGATCSRGKVFNEEILYHAIEELMLREREITQTEIASKIGCSISTVKRNMSDDIKSIMQAHNEDIRMKRDIDRFFDATISLSTAGTKWNRTNLKRESGLKGERIKEICDNYDILRHQKGSNN